MLVRKYAGFAKAKRSRSCRRKWRPRSKIHKADAPCTVPHPIRDCEIFRASAFSPFRPFSSKRGGVARARQAGLQQGGERMESNGKMRSLEDTCFLKIAQSPESSLNPARVRNNGRTAEGWPAGLPCCFPALRSPHSSQLAAAVVHEGM